MMSSEIVGSGTRRVYHKLSCRWAKQINPENRQVFRGRAEAREGGFRPCQVCQPDQYWKLPEGLVHDLEDRLLGDRSDPEAIVAQYLLDIGRYERIEDAEAERELVRKAQTGDEEAARRVVEANLRNVLAYVLTPEGVPESLPDRISTGNLSLLRAIETFDPDKGVRFFSYAEKLVHDGVARGRQPKVRDAGKRPVKLAPNPLLSGLSTVPISVVWEKVGLDASVGPFGKWFKEIAQDILSEREQKILLLTLGDVYPTPTLRQVGEALGLSGERIRQIRDEAMAKLKRSSEGDALKYFWSDE